MEKQDNTSIRLSAIKEMSFEKNWSDETLKNLTQDNIRIYYRTGALIHTAKDMITVTVGIRYNIEDIELFTLDISLNYDIHHLSKIMTIDENKHELVFDNDILPTLFSAAIGTLRGVLYSKTIGTELEKFPMPMVLLDDIIDNNNIVLNK